MFHSFKKFFLLLLVVLPCCFAEAADRFQAILDARVDIKPYLQEIGYSSEEICGKLDIAKMEIVLDHIYDIGKKEIETKGIDIDENRLLKSVFVTLKQPDQVLNFETEHDLYYEKYIGQYLCNSYWEFEKAIKEKTLSYYSRLYHIFKEHKGNVQQLEN